MEVATAHSIASLAKLLYVSEPWLDRVFPDLDGDERLASIVKHPGKAHEAAWSDAHERSKALITTMEPYRSHESVVSDSLEELLEEPFVLLDPIGSGNKRVGVEPHSPRNDLRSRLASIGTGRFFWVGPLLVPFDVAHGALSLPLAQKLEARFDPGDDPFSGYVRFNPNLFEAHIDPFSRRDTSLRRAQAAIARSMLSVRVRAIDDIVSKNVRDEIRVYSFSSGPLMRALDEAPRSLLVSERYKQVGGRTSSGRAADEQGLVSDAAIGKVAGYFGAGDKPMSHRPKPRYMSNEKYPWLLEPSPSSLDFLVNRLERFGETLERFGELARDRGWGVTHAIARLDELSSVRVSLADGSTRSLSSLAHTIGSSRITPGTAEGVVIRPSDAMVAPYGCPLAHHVSRIDAETRRELLRAGIEGSHEDIRTAMLEHRDSELRSLWPRYGEIIHEVYTTPWVPFGSRYGELEDLVERKLEATIATSKGPAAIKARADILLEGHSDAGVVPIVIDRKLSYATESMRHAHRLQLALTLAAYRELSDESMPYAIGIIDASAPYTPSPRGYRPQRFTARLFSHDELDSALERAMDVAIRRDAIRSDDSILEAKRSSEQYQVGPKGGRASPLCSSCGVLSMGPDGLGWKGSLAIRMVCDSIVERAGS